MSPSIKMISSYKLMPNKSVMMTACAKLDSMSINPNNKIVWINNKIISKNKNNKKTPTHKPCIKLYYKKLKQENSPANPLPL